MTPDARTEPADPLDIDPQDAVATHASYLYREAMGVRPVDIARLIHDATAGIDTIAEQLDRASHEERIGALHSLDRSAQRALYRKAADSRPLHLDDFVPRTVPALVEVRHFGRNTLPLPPAHRLFEKRFCRPDDGSERLFGYNHAPSKWLIGPGYFVLMPTSGHARWQERGALLVDYFQVPDGPVPDHWPAVVRNARGLQRFVYDGTRDFLRRVSTHVTIGAAYKGERALDHYFVLCREPQA